LIDALVLALTFALAIGSAPTSAGPSTFEMSPAFYASGFGAFGAAVAVDGGRIYVGAPGEVTLFPMPSGRAGAVYEFTRAAGGEWTRTVLPTPEDVAVEDLFGAAVSVRGDRMAVGAPRGAGGGAVYIFARNADGAWSEAARLALDGGAPEDGFGSAVALAGDRLLVGAPGSHGLAGSVHAYRLDGGDWVLDGSATGEAPNGRFGAAVALDAVSGVAVAGAPGPLPPSFPAGPQLQPGPGAVHIIETAGSEWRVMPLEAGGEGPGMLGFALAMDGDVLYAGQPLQGRVFRFARSDGGWAVTDTLTSGAPGQSGFGMSLALAGSDLWVAEPMAAQGGGANRVQVLTPDGEGGWSRTTLDGPAGGSLMFGLGLAASESLAVVGVPGLDVFEGAARVFARSAGGWAETDALLRPVEVPLASVTGAPRPCTEGSAEGRPCDGVDLLAFLSVGDLGGERGVIVNDVWGWVDPETAREYALVGRSDGMVFVDITQPSSPRYLGELPMTEGAQANFWRDVKTYGNYAFVVADGAGEHGMQVFDLTRLRDVEDAPAVFDADAHYDGLHSAHNIVIDPEAGLAAAVGVSGGGNTCGGGLHMIDITEPLSPTFAGCFADPTTGMGSGYSHDAQCVTYAGPDERYTGHRICLGSNANALSVADVTDPSSPVALAAATYPNSAFLHQGWLTDDHRYFYMNDETDEIAGLAPRTRTLVWDLSELDDPVLVNEHLGTNAASDHNLYVRGDTMYQANYVSGLRLLDISDPESPREVGFFDTVPGGADRPGFNGAWSVYPFFPSGTLIVTSVREGLFVLRPRPKPVS
jgi:choice-of-anchor B domain-containing protein